jgi:hypothetical protein
MGLKVKRVATAPTGVVTIGKLAMGDLFCFTDDPSKLCWKDPEYHVPGKTWYKVVGVVSPDSLFMWRVSDWSAHYCAADLAVIPFKP